MPPVVRDPLPPDTERTPAPAERAAGASLPAPLSLAARSAAPVPAAALSPAAALEAVPAAAPELEGEVPFRPPTPVELVEVSFPASVLEETLPELPDLLLSMR